MLTNTIFEHGIPDKVYFVHRSTETYMSRLSLNEATATTAYLFQAHAGISPVC